MRALLIVAVLAGAVSANTTTRFEVHVHVAPRGDGLVVTQDWITAQLATANRLFGALDVSFQIKAVSELPESAAHLATRADRGALATYVKGRVIHVFVTGQLDNVDDDQPVYGVTWRAGSRKFVILAADAHEIVLAHELGHVFGLPHSTHAVSIMNKTKRAEPPLQDRKFADEELAAMRKTVKRLVRTNVLDDVRYDARNDR